MPLSLDDGGVSDARSRRLRRRGQYQPGGTLGGYAAWRRARDHPIGPAAVVAVITATEVTAAIPSDTRIGRVSVLHRLTTTAAPPLHRSLTFPCTAATLVRRRDRSVRRGLHATLLVPALRPHMGPSVRLPHHWATSCVRREAFQERATHPDSPERQGEHRALRGAVSLSEFHQILPNIAERR